MSDDKGEPGANPAPASASSRTTGCTIGSGKFGVSQDRLRADVANQADDVERKMRGTR